MCVYMYMYICRSQYCTYGRFHEKVDMAKKNEIAPRIVFLPLYYSKHMQRSGKQKLQCLLIAYCEKNQPFSDSAL